jgi:CCR4-NOT transcription complex subunit 4
MFDGITVDRPDPRKTESRANGITESVLETPPVLAPGPLVSSLISTPVLTTNSTPSRKASRKLSPTPVPLPLVVEQEPLLSRKARKNKPTRRPLKAPKEKEKSKEAGGVVPVATNGPSSARELSSSGSEVLTTGPGEPQLSSGVRERTGFEELAHIVRDLHLDSLSFFDRTSISPKTQLPLRYGPLVYALSALSIGGAGAFSNSLPAGSIDSAVTSFQQLLETLTQTISDLLRLFPRATWNDTASFDGVLQDMLRSEDFLDDVSVADHVAAASGRDEEVAALTRALEKRARWMEVQLAKLEELHRDINLAAVRAIMSFNDRGWDRSKVLPRSSGSLARFDALGTVAEAEGSVRDMTILELEEAHVKALEMETAAEVELTKVLEANQALLLLAA